MDVITATAIRSDDGIVDIFVIGGTGRARLREFNPLESANCFATAGRTRVTTRRPCWHSTTKRRDRKAQLSPALNGTRAMAKL
jgi:hypothetical protein